MAIRGRAGGTFRLPTLPAARECFQPTERIARLSPRHETVALRDFSRSYDRFGHKRRSQLGRGPGACPLWSESDRIGASRRNVAECHKPTHAPQQNDDAHVLIVGATEQTKRGCDAERLGGLEVDKELDPYGLLDRQAGEVGHGRRRVRHLQRGAIRMIVSMLSSATVRSSLG